MEEVRGASGAADAAKSPNRTSRASAAPAFSCRSSCATARLWIVFTRRTESVEHHRGQISFPGGGDEPGDATLWQTALRESEEELGIRPGDAVALGRLSPLTTVTDFYVEPFVAAIPQPYVFRPAEAEIAEVIEVPVAALQDPAILEKRKLPGREEPVLFYRLRRARDLGRDRAHGRGALGGHRLGDRRRRDHCSRRDEVSRVTERTGPQASEGDV